MAATRRKNLSGLKRYEANVNALGRGHKPNRFAGFVTGQHASAAKFKEFIATLPEYRGLKFGRVKCLGPL
jgi:hypothetical protein